MVEFYKNYFNTNLSFLNKFNIKIDYLYYKNNNYNKIFTDTLLILFHKADMIFVIKDYINYYFEPLKYYILNDISQIDNILYDKTKQYDIEKEYSIKWSIFSKSKKSISKEDQLLFLCNIIEDEINNQNTFFGAKLN